MNLLELLILEAGNHALDRPYRNRMNLAIRYDNLEAIKLEQVPAVKVHKLMSNLDLEHYPMTLVRQVTLEVQDVAQRDR